jgi:TonB family protein
MSSRTVDFPSPAASSAAGTEGFSRANPVCTEIGVSVQGSSHASASGQTSHPFLEQTTTVIVFAQGAVVRLSDTVAPGQILIMRHLQSNQEAACRVVSVKANANVKGYVELEFLQPTPNFWGKDFQAANGAKTPSAAAPRPVAPIRAERDASTIRPEHDASTSAPIRSEPDAAPATVEHVSPISAPKAPAAPRPISPVPAARSTVSPVDTSNTAANSGPSFLPDLLDTLTLPPEARQRAIEGIRPDAIRTTPPPIHAERDSSPQVAPPKPPQAPWPSVPAAKTDAAKSAPMVGDARYMADLLETLTPIGETLLSEKAKSAPQQPQIAPPAPAISRPAFVAPTPSEIALPPIAAEPATVPVQASSPRVKPSIPAEVAPMQAESEVTARPQLFGVGVAPAQTSEGSPKPMPMRILAIAAAVALALAAGAGIYRWHRKAAPGANLAASSQPAASAPAAGAAAAPTAAATAAPTTNNSHSKTQNASASTTKNSAEAPTAKAQPAQRSKVAASMAMSAPSAAARTTNQAAPTIGAAMPNAAQSASVGGLLSEGPSGPAVPQARTSSGVVQPRLLGGAPAPVYPDAAKADRVQGDVSVDLLINEAGKVASMTVISGPAILRPAALDALRQRKYSPAMLDGKPTTTHIVVVIHFQL